MENEEYSEKDESEKDSKSSIIGNMRENPWILSTFVLGVLVLILIVGSFSGTLTGHAVSANDAGQQMLDYFNSNGVQGLAVDSVDEVSGVYKINFEYNGAVVPYYVTKDGKLAGSLSPVKITNSDSTDSSNSQSTSSSARVDVGVDDDAIKGDSNALVTIIEFSDYECPFCGRYFQQTYPQIIREYVDSGKVKIVFRDFPLSFHENAQKAGEAAECAGEEGNEAYWKMHDKLFENQDKLDIDSLKQYAKDIGLNSNNFNKCLDSGKMASEIQKDFKDGQDAGVSGTPAFFINGIPLTGAQPFEAFKKIIDTELEKA